MSKKLTCKICGYESRNLEPHISSAHADIGLEGYMKQFDCDIEDIILLNKEEDTVEKKATKKVAKKKATKKATKEATPVSTSTVEICGVELPISNSERFVPSNNSAYLFGEHTKDIAYDILDNKRVLLTGHTGCGKTSVIQQIASECKQGTIRVNLNGQTTVGDFVGLWTVKGGETVWVDGALPIAMREGHWLILDEIDFAEPAILAILNAVLEVGQDFVLKEKGYEVIKPHENFRIFATANTVGCMQEFRGLYQGANILNEAFLDRWRVYHVDYLPQEQEIKVINDSIKNMTKNIATRIVMVANMVREAFVNEEVSCTFSLRRALDWGELMIRHRNPFSSAKSTIFSKISREDAEVIDGIVKRVMENNKK